MRSEEEPRWRPRFDLSRWLTPVHLAACDWVGPGTRAYGRPIVHNLGRIVIGERTIVRSLATPVRMWASRSGTIDIGAAVTIEMGASILSDVQVSIGPGTEIGPHAVVRDMDDAGSSSPVTIGANVKLGARVRVERGAQIGDGAVVLPGSVVRGAVPAGAVVAGDPARPVTDGSTTNGSSAEPPKATNGVTAPSTPAAAALPVTTVHGVLIADFTIEELAEHLARVDVEGLRVEAETAPFGQIVQTLHALQSREPKEDFAVVWTRPEQAVPSFLDLMRGAPVPQERLLEEVDAFASLIRAHAGAARFLFVPSWTLPPQSRGFGMLELRADRPTAALMRMNLRLADALADVANVFVLDAQRWLGSARDGGVNAKLWYAGKIAFTSEVFAEAAADVRAALRGVLGQSKKLVVLDLDDTLWGGIVGDAGWENLRLGGHDPVGEALVEFQQRLVGLTRRGIALAVVSKNEESTALEAMRKHPEMIIRPELLAAYRINWRDKAQNIVEIAQELNLGLQSLVFIDDNPVERGRVREALPEVFVPDWPADFTGYPHALEALHCFDLPTVTKEDVERSAMYGVERERTAIKTNFKSIDEWIASLDLVVRFEALSEGNLPRTAQLLNKTNQMNLRTRRLGEPELLAWAREKDHELWAVHVADRFGDSGLTGILGLARRGTEVSIEDYVLSCRVMGRRVEETLLWAAVQRARLMGGRTLVVEPLPTKKNKPCLDFFAAAGLPKVGDRYEWPLERPREPPALVKITGLEDT